MPTPKPRPPQKAHSPARRTSKNSAKTAPREIDLSPAATRNGAKRPKTSRAMKRPVLDANDPGVKRRARKKSAARKKNLMVWGTFLCLTAVISGASRAVYERYESAQTLVSEKRATLTDLQRQLAEKTARLRAMNSNAGKERQLVENGYIREGERLLLFPKERE